MFSQEIKRVNHRRGFTLIELLVVIAIIAILAALLFPVFATFRENVRQKQCMTQMHDVWVAVSQYQLDHHAYPETLYDYAELPAGAYYIGIGAPVPMNQAKLKPLFAIGAGKYMKDPSLFTCPDDVPTQPTDVTTAVFPTAPGVTRVGTVPNVFSPANPAYYYKADSYDVGTQVNAQGVVVMSGGKPVVELHYSRNWTNVTGPGDAVNQMKYPDPPQDKTVLTWCTYHVAVAHSNIIPVMMLSGTCKPIATDQFVKQGPVNYKF